LAELLVITLSVGLELCSKQPMITADKMSIEAAFGRELFDSVLFLRSRFNCCWQRGYFFRGYRWLCAC
jgi:hypothetical protein